jgi:hypothetical protein
MTNHNRRDLKRTSDRELTYDIEFTRHQRHAIVAALRPPSGSAAARMHSAPAAPRRAERFRPRRSVHADPQTPN